MREFDKTPVDALADEIAEQIDAGMQRSCGETCSAPIARAGWLDTLLSLIGLKRLNGGRDA